MSSILLLIKDQKTKHVNKQKGGSDFEKDVWSWFKNKTKKSSDKNNDFITTKKRVV